MLRFILITLLYLLSSSTVLFAQEDKPIKIGVLLSLSGGLEQWCGYIREGIELALDSLPKDQIEVIFEDDRSLDKKATLTAAQKLLTVDQVDLLYTWTASTVPLLSSVATRAKIPLLVGAYDKNVKQAGPYVFGSLVNYELLPRQIAHFLIEQKKASRFALIMAADDWSQSFSEPFMSELTKQGKELVLSETIAVNETDTRSLILRLKKEKVDAVLAPLYANSLYSFLKQARELKFLGSIHVGDGMFEEDIKVTGSVSEGVYATQIWLESTLFNDVLKKHGKAISSPLQQGLIAGGYDWVKHVYEAHHKLKSDTDGFSKDRFLQILSTYRSNGFLGEYLLGVAPLTSGEVNVVVNNGRYVRVSSS